MSPYVEPFIDVSMVKGDNWVTVFRDTINTSDLCFLFLDGNEMGPGQQAEIDEIQARLMTPEGQDYRVVPVLGSGPSPRLPLFLSTRHSVTFNDLTDRKLREILWSLFPRRFPDNWGTPSDASARYVNGDAYDGTVARDEKKSPKDYGSFQGEV